MKQVWRLVLNYLRDWKVPFKELEGRKTGQFKDLMLQKLKKHESSNRLICTGFEWISTWKSTAEGSAHGG